MRRVLIPISRRRGFTLIEVITSIAVLTLLILMVTQMVNGTTILTEGSRRHMDSDGQARGVFDRLAVDLGGMVLRPDADCLFVKSTGNDKMFFYSETPAYFSGSPASQNCSPLSLVGYRIYTDTTTPPRLERLGKGLTWAGAPSPIPGTSPPEVQGGAPVFLTYPTPAASPIPGAAASPTPAPLPGSTLAGNWSTTIGMSPDYTTGADADYRVASNGVFRFEYCFLMKDGMLSTQPFTAPHTTAEGLQDVVAIIVAIAVLDDTSRQIAAPNDALVTALVDFAGVDGVELPANTPLMGTVWQDKINTPGFAPTGIPAAVASKVHVYQRYFYLHTK